jgi:predicted signal transduction protein with EAL and GGDEF domain
MMSAAGRRARPLKITCAGGPRALAAVRIAVNVSPMQLRNRHFIAEVEQAINGDAHAAAGLELEITESLIREDVKHSIGGLQSIRAMGVSIAIDDFGTGFSSLSYRAKLPVDTLKIDRSFVVDMGSGPEGLALVSTIVNLAHSLKLKVVAVTWLDSSEFPEASLDSIPEPPELAAAGHMCANPSQRIAGQGVVEPESFGRHCASLSFARQHLDDQHFAALDDAFVEHTI